MPGGTTVNTDMTLLYTPIIRTMKEDSNIDTPESSLPTVVNKHTSSMMKQEQLSTKHEKERVKEQQSIFLVLLHHM